MPDWDAELARLADRMAREEHAASPTRKDFPSYRKYTILAALEADARQLERMLHG